MNTGLSISDVVSVSINLSATAAQQRNFGVPLILGDSNVIDVTTRLRLYTSLAGVGGDFGSTAPEYLAAAAFFGQSPTPAACYVGRWASTATAGALFGAPLSTAAQALTNFTSVSNGGMGITINGSSYPLTGLNFTGATNLNGVASILQAALTGVATVTWVAAESQFVVQSATTGTSSTVGFATTGTGTDVSNLFGLNAADSGVYAVTGIAAETIESAVTTHLGLSNAWYALAIASTATVADADMVNVAGLIQAASPSRIFLATTQEAGALISGYVSDLPSMLQAASYSRSFCQYSSTSKYAALASFGIAASVNFNGTGTTLTLKFQQPAGITAETLTEAQAATLIAENCNTVVNYNATTGTATPILQPGVMSSGAYFDTIQGTDWFQNAVQVALFNVLLTAGTKIPQTDAGVNQLVAAVTQQCEQAVANGLIAPGTWTGPAVGSVVTGQTLSKGYYIYAPPVSSQSVAARAARQAPVIQVAVKLAGAIHSSAVIVTVNQ